MVIAGQRTVIGCCEPAVSAGEQAPAAEVMQPGPTTVRAQEDLAATRQRINEHHVAHLLVTTPDGTLLGVVDLQIADVQVDLDGNSMVHAQVHGGAGAAVPRGAAAHWLAASGALVGERLGASRAARQSPDSNASHRGP